MCVCVLVHLSPISLLVFTAYFPFLYIVSSFLLQRLKIISLSACAFIIAQPKMFGLESGLSAPQARFQPGIQRDSRATCSRNYGTPPLWTKYVVSKSYPILFRDPRSRVRDSRSLLRDPRSLPRDPRSIVRDLRSLLRDPRSSSAVTPRSSIPLGRYSAILDPPRPLLRDPRSPRSLLRDRRSMLGDSRSLLSDPR